MSGAEVGSQGIETRVARAIAVGRVAVGTALLIAPSAVGAPWIGRDARRPGTRVFARALGIRDLVLGLGTLAALGTPHAPRFLVGCAAVDFTDGAATWSERSRLPAAARAVAAGAGLTAATEAVLAARR